MARQGKSREDHRCVLLDGLRLPFAKANTLYKNETAQGLGSRLVSQWLERCWIKMDCLDRILLGQAYGDPFIQQQPDYFQQIELLPAAPTEIMTHADQALGAGVLGKARELIVSQQADVVLCVGMEGAPTVQSAQTQPIGWLMDRMFPLEQGSPTLSQQKLKMDGLLLAAEDLSDVLKIPIDAHHRVACDSHHRAAQAWEKDFFSADSMPMFAQDDGLFSSYTRRAKDNQHGTGVIFQDPGIRMNCHPRALASLPVQRPNARYHLHHAHLGYPADGAALVLLASKRFADQHQLPWQIEIVDHLQQSAQRTEGMLLGVVPAMHGVLQRNGLTLSEIASIDIHEDTTATLLALQTYLQSMVFVDRQSSSLSDPLKQPTINPCGGAIALGDGGSASMLRQLLVMARYGQYHQHHHTILAYEHGSHQGDVVLLKHNKHP